VRLAFEEVVLDELQTRVVAEDPLLL